MKSHECMRNGKQTAIQEKDKPDLCPQFAR